MGNERKDSVLRMVMPGHELCLDISQFAVPSWMPSVSIDDNAALHESLRSHLSEAIVAGNAIAVGNALREFIYTCWQRRLPLDGKAIWPMLEAHGVDQHLKNAVGDVFDFGIDLLRSTQGRPPVKRKLMPAMSKGRYLTPTERKFASVSSSIADSKA
jgi:hypothetical protein